MQKQFFHAGTIEKLDQSTDDISLPVYAFGVVVAFLFVNAVLFVVALVVAVLADRPEMWREATTATFFVWTIPIGLITNAARDGLRVVVVVNEKERIEYRFVRTTRGDELDMKDLHTWLCDMKLTGRTGMHRFRAISLVTGNASSDEHYRELKKILKDNGLIEELGSKKQGWRIINFDYDYAASKLSLPPLEVPHHIPYQARDDRQDTTRQ